MAKVLEQCKSRRAQSLTEYTLLLALISIVAIGALVALGGKTSNTFEGAGEAFPGGGGCASQSVRVPRAAPR